MCVTQARPSGQSSTWRDHAKTFRRTVLDLMRAQDAGIGPTLAAKPVAERDDVMVGVVTLRQWMIAIGLWRSSRRRVPSPYGSFRMLLTRLSPTTRLIGPGDGVPRPVPQWLMTPTTIASARAFGKDGRP